MSKYQELTDLYNSIEGGIDEIENSFNKTFQEGFASHIDCKPELIGSKMIGSPKKGKAPLVLYAFEVSIDLISSEHPTIRLTLPIKAIGIPGGTDVTKFSIKIREEQSAQSYQLGDEFYQVLYDKFKKKLAESGSLKRR